MAPPEDTRTVIGSFVQAKASQITHEASVIFGSNWKTLLLTGKVVNVEIDYPKGRKRTFIEADYTIKPGQIKRKKLNIKSVSSITQEETISGAQDSELRAVNVNGVDWEPGMAFVPIGGPVARQLWSFVSHSGETFTESTVPARRNPLDCFLDSFPTSYLSRIVDLTNSKLSHYELQETTREELLQYFGVLILCTRFEFGDRYDLWNSLPTSEFIPAANFGKTGLCRKRFTDLSRFISFSQPNGYEISSDASERWGLVDDFVSAFNNHRQESFSPSEVICADESMSKWYGVGGDWISAGLPHYVSLDRKPENGAEIQNVACARSGVMLRLKLVKGTQVDNNDAEDEIVPHGGMILYNLLLPWRGTGRLAVGDAYFASVATAHKLLSIDFKFIGTVKQCYRRFPMKVLSEQELQSRGSFCSMIHKDDRGIIEMLALAWRDRSRHYFVSTAGDTQPGETVIRTRLREIAEGANHVKTPVSMPSVIQLYYQCSSSIDRHNRSRQDDLMLERKLGTKRWDFRLNCSILGIIIVDSWLMYCGVNGAGKELNQRKYYEELATLLIKQNQIDARGRACVQQTVSRAATGIHLIFTSKKRPSTGTAQKICRICKRKTSYYCSVCSGNDENGEWFCHSKTGRTCFDSHLKNVHKC